MLVKNTGAKEVEAPLVLEPIHPKHFDDRIPLMIDRVNTDIGGSSDI